MQVDTLITKRFEDLLDDANKIPHCSGGLYGNTDCVESKGYLKWSTSAMSCIENVWGKNSNYYVKFCDTNDTRYYTYFSLLNGIGVLEAAYSDYKSGYIWTYRIALGSELLTDTLEQGYELLKGKYKDSACVCGRVSLEIALKELCVKNGIAIAKLNKMNEDLCKFGVFNMGMQKQITAWADRGNDAAHGNFANYTENDVSLMLDGISSFIAMYMT